MAGSNSKSGSSGSVCVCRRICFLFLWQKLQSCVGVVWEIIEAYSVTVHFVFLAFVLVGQQSKLKFS